MIIFPEPTTLNLVLYGAFFLLAASIGPADYFGQMPMRYSKFRTRAGIPSRVGMFLLYFVPILAAVWFALPYAPSVRLAQGLVLAALVGHYAKRCLEVLFVHKYSGPMDWMTTLMIAGFYTLVAAGVSALNGSPLAAADGFFWLGAFFFLLGEGLNFWHHKILADLRRDSRDYVVPRGGLFELLAWLGLAFMSRHLFIYIAFLGMLGYLLARGLKTLAWYRSRFADFPKARKALIPWLI